MMRETRLLGLLLLFCMIAAPVTAFAATSGPSPIPPPPNFQLSTNVTTLCKGLVNNVPISIRTPVGASTMQDVELSITSTRSAYTVGNGTVSAVNITANLTKTVNMPVFVSLNASSLISTGIAINYQYLTLYSDSEVRNISFGVETCPTPLTISILPKVLISGKIENITLNLTNNGKTALNYISMHASVPNMDGTFLGIQPIQVRTIAPRNSVNLGESVFIYSNASQSFPMNFSISLYNGTQIEQIAYNPIVLSSGIINITPSSVTISPQKPTAGGIFSISLVLTDVGTAGASTVTVTPLPTAGFEAYGSNSTFVGDMQADVQTPVTLTLTSLTSLKAGNYVIPVRINYLNNLRQNLSTTVEVPVAVGGSASTFNALSAAARQYGSSRGSTSLILVAVLAIVAIVFIVLFLRERKGYKLLKDEHKRLREHAKERPTR